MKYRCPYCKALSEELHATCPSCGKTMNIPVNLLGKSARERRRAKDRIRREAERQSVAHLRPESFIGRKTSHIVFIMLFMAALGAMILTRSKEATTRERGFSEAEVAAIELRRVRVCLELFKRDCGRYPDTEEGLLALVVNPGVTNWGGPYVTLMKNDPWAHPYVYTVQSNEVEVRSAGPDGLPQTDDDLLPDEWTDDPLLATNAAAVPAAPLTPAPAVTNAIGYPVRIR